MLPGQRVAFGLSLTKEIMCERETGKQQKETDCGVCSALCRALGSRYHSPFEGAWVQTVMAPRGVPSCRRRGLTYSWIRTRRKNRPEAGAL